MDPFLYLDRDTWVHRLDPRTKMVLLIGVFVLAFLFVNPLYGLVVLAIVGKVAAGWAAPWVRFRRLVVGVGMVPRGEVGLIFADIGRRAGVLNEAVFGAVLIMIMITTFVAPPTLKLLFGLRTSGPSP